jgi:glycopeptide antibiotics resistance protein
MYRSFGYLIPMFLVGVVLLPAVMLVVNWKKVRTRKIDWPRFFLAWCILAWFLGLGLITLMPTSGVIGERAISLVPLQELIFHGPGIGYSVLKEGAANIFLFASGSVALSLYGRASVFQTALVATGIALVIEVLQYVLALGRISSIDDLLWAFTGGLLGSAVGVLLRKRATAKTRSAARL